MLAKLARELPVGDHAFEPKWDGFRCLVFRDGDDIDLRSRQGRPMARYFPDVVAALRSSRASRVVLDGEIVVTTADGIDFDALLKRIHPAAKHIDRLVETTSATFIAFDVLAVDDRDLRDVAFDERRRCLEALLVDVDAGVQLGPLTWDADMARRWLDALPPGTDGVVAKRRDLPYLCGKRAMLKVK